MHLPIDISPSCTAARDDANRWSRCIAHPSLPLHLEPLDLEHSVSFLYQYRNPEIARFTRMPVFASLADLRRWMRESIDTQERERFALMHRDDGFVGYLSLRVRRTQASFSFWMGTDHQGRGFAVPAARLLCDYAHAHGVHRIDASAFSDNLRSIRALGWAGFRYVGVRGSNTDERCLFVRHGGNERVGTRLFSR